MGRIVGAALAGPWGGARRDGKFVVRLMQDALDAVQPDTLVLFDAGWIVKNGHGLVGARSFRVPPIAGEISSATDLSNAIVETGKLRKLAIHNHMDVGLGEAATEIVRQLWRGETVLSVGISQTTSVKAHLAFGAAIGEAIRRQPGRVMMIAAGGIGQGRAPVDLARAIKPVAGDKRIFSSAEEMDDQFIRHWMRGEHAEVIRLYPAYRQFYPDGNFGHYLTMVGALGGQACRARGINLAPGNMSFDAVRMWFDLAA